MEKEEEEEEDKEEEKEEEEKEKGLRGNRFPSPGFEVHSREN